MAAFVLSLWSESHATTSGRNVHEQLALIVRAHTRYNELHRCPLRERKGIAQILEITINLRLSSTEKCVPLPRRAALEQTPRQVENSYTLSQYTTITISTLVLLVVHYRGRLNKLSHLFYSVDLAVSLGCTFVPVCYRFPICRVLGPVLFDGCLL